MKTVAAQVGLQNASSSTRMSGVIEKIGTRDREWRKHRDAERLEYRAYLVIGLALVLPVVAVRRFISLFARTESGVRPSGFLCEAQEEVQNILAWVFMA